MLNRAGDGWLLKVFIILVMLKSHRLCLRSERCIPCTSRIAELVWERRAVASCLGNCPMLFFHCEGREETPYGT